MKTPTSSQQIAFIGAGIILIQPAFAAVVGVENFNYADGAINGQTGGTGWVYERTDEAGAPAQTPSNWNNVGGAPNVVGNALVTSGTSAKREYGGVTEGSAAGSNEREGAFRGSGTLYFRTTYRVDTLLGVGVNQWGGVSSYDFGTERVFFGMPGQTGATRFFGIDESGVGANLSTISIDAGVTYTLVGVVDFDSDRVAMWVNPDGSDTVSSFDVSRAYTASNWASALRIGSASGANVTWDNLVVADSFADVIPEASSSMLGLMGGAALLNRRRRKI